MSSAKDRGFPHSEISGSKVARHLPEAYRSHATSFIASFSLGIHRTPLDFLLGNLKTACPVARERLDFPNMLSRTYLGNSIFFCPVRDRSLYNDR